MESAYSTVRNEDGRGRVFQPEYISLTMLPSGQRTKAEMAGRTRDNVTTVMLKQRVVRAPNGDVYLDVPMHDQGEKGYCAAAAVERLLDFYGSSVSQHEIAQRIQMGAEGATFEGILRGLRSLATMLRLQVRVIMESDDKVFMKWIDEYNKMAKRERKLPIDFDTIGKEYGPKTIWDAFDKDVFLKSRIRTPVPVNRFFEQCKQKIDNGIPLIQTCMIGILPEEAKLGQPPGGHARLIIGYNIAQKELLYTDSWGLGHERKRLPIDHTYAITTGLLTVEPR
ncbi:MAG: C39 family peptidase, partial [Kiritimatiellia bacterium]|nr:C39 family peptidase [Kiritimatiellia bacterium]